MSQVDRIDKTVEKTNIWLNALAAELGGDGQLAAQLPELIRGIYYEGWVRARTPGNYRTADDFLERVAKEAQLPGETQAAHACQAAARVLRRHVSQGEIDDVVSVFPEEMRPVLAG